MNSQNSYKPTAVVLGPAVIDSRVDPAPDSTSGHKYEASIQDRLGGGAANVARQFSKLGLAVKPILLTGNDSLHAVAESLVQQEFKQRATCPQLMHSTRRSVLIRNTVYTLRSAVAQHELPREIMREIKAAGIVVLAPLAAEDHSIAVQVLQASSFSLLQLSNQQLQHPKKAIELASLADMTVINDAELELWTGCNETSAGIRWLRDRGVNAVIVTSKTSATGFVGGQWIHAPAYETGKLVSSVGAGDVLMGTLAAMRLNGEPWKESLQLAMAAAALHVEAKPASGIPDLQRVARHRKTIPFLPNPSRQLINLPRVATIAAGLFLGLLTFGLFS
tara:strand:+ start:4810 stop:5811 length:1002 start_codon:yes stop_codon:yes gene_type:complete